MPRLIDADALMEYLEEYHCDDWLLNQYNADWIASWVEGQPTIEAEPRWIPATERLPEEYGRYLCVKRIGKSGAVYVTVMNGDSHGFSVEHIYTDDVTHWMPLPEPPKADE